MSGTKDLPSLIRGNCRIEWVVVKGEENNEGLQLLRFNSYGRVNEKWLPLKKGSVLTQVRSNEDPEIIELLLEKLADRIKPLVEKGEVGESEIDLKEEGSELFEKMKWFGPEFAEEY